MYASQGICEKLAMGAPRKSWLLPLSRFHLCLEWARKSLPGKDFLVEPSFVKDHQCFGPPALDAPLKRSQEAIGVIIGMALL